MAKLVRGWSVTETPVSCTQVSHNLTDAYVVPFILYKRSGNGPMVAVPVHIKKTCARIAAALPIVVTLDVATAQSQDCADYARAYADSHINTDPSDIDIADRAMRGAIAGGAWQGPGGAERGATVGGAIAVLDKLGNTASGWRGLYDMAYRLCRNAASPVTHRPQTIGDPSYRTPLPPTAKPAPPLPRSKLAPPLPK